MKQLDMVINWIKFEWGNSIYSINTSGDRYYGYSFYGKRKWDGMFNDDIEYLKLHYKHVIDINNNYEVIK